MATEKRPSHDMPEAKQVESLSEEHGAPHGAEEAADLEKSPGGVRRGADYSGAVEKTDPKEIALVRKLDQSVSPVVLGI